MVRLVKEDAVKVISTEFLYIVKATCYVKLHVFIYSLFFHLPPMRAVKLRFQTQSKFPYDRDKQNLRARHA